MKPEEIPMLIREQAPYVFDRMFNAVEKVRERLERVCYALGDAKVPYAVIGGHAVAAWVATRDEGAVRTTRDVDILLNRSDDKAATSALERVGFIRDVAMEVPLFLDGPDGKPSQAVHVIWAGEKVKSDYPLASPDITSSRNIDGKLIVDLPALLRMKLLANRRKDQVHILDMIGVGLIDQEWVARLESPLLAQRLQALIDDPEG